MDAPTTDALKVPGASLYYEVRGAGPVLLLIHGGDGGTDLFERVANELADRYTVVTYVRRGFSRSPLDGPVDDRRRLETDRDDARRLLERLADGPAYVFGSSSGAIVGLELIARHPEQVRTLVAHEPPAVTLLPDAARHLEFVDEVYDTYLSSGVEPAMWEFGAEMGLDYPEPPESSEPSPQDPQMASIVHGNLEFWLEHELRQYPRVVPDVAALKAVSTRLVLAGGHDSREHLPYRPNTVLAEQLASEVVDFPGGHMGYATHPSDFAARLSDVLTAPDAAGHPAPAKGQSRMSTETPMTRDEDLTDTADREAAVRWVRDYAHPLTALDPEAPLTDLEPLRHMLRHATVVGLGASTRGAHELSVLDHRVLKFLVEEMGFRSLALEEDWTKGIQLDEYVRTGKGDPRALMADAWPPWRTEELLDALRWMRSYNRQHPEDPLRFAGLDFMTVNSLAYDAVTGYVRRTAPDRLAELEAHYVLLRPTGEIAGHVEWYRSQPDKQPLVDHARLAYDLVDGLPARDGHALARQHARAVVSFYEYHALGSLAYAEQRMAENVILWHDHTGHKIVYWGGMAHTANGNPRTVSSPGDPPTAERSAGSYLRDHFGEGYASIGLTFGHGSVPYPVPAPPPEFADAVLGAAGMDTYLLDLHAPQPRAVQAWLDAPAKLRLIGPGYNPEYDSAHHMSGGSLADWFDVIVHAREVTPIRPLP